MPYSIYTSIALTLLLLLVASLPARWLHFYPASRSGLLNIFFSNLFTALIFTSIFAASKAGPHTVLLLAFPVIIFFCLVQKPAPQSIRLNDLVRELLPSATLVLLCSFFTFIYILPRSIESDVTYYAKLASYLKDRGIENNFHYYNDLLQAKLGLIPYHYYELWLSALVSYLTGFTQLINLKFVVYPYLMTICLVGMLGVYEHFSNKKVTFFTTLSAFFLVFLLAIFGQYISIWCSGWDILSSLWLRPNFLLNYLVLVPLVLALYNRDLKLLSFASMLACLFSVTLIPSLLPAIFIYLAYTWYFQKVSFRKVFAQVAVIVAFVLLYYLFYAFNGGDFNFIESRSINSIILTSFKIWKATVGTFLNITIRCLLFALLFLFLYRQRFFTKDVVVFFVLIIVIAVGSFQLLNQMDNSYQLPHFAYCLLGFLLVLSCLYFIDKAKPVVQIACTTALVIFGILANKNQVIPAKDFKDNRRFFISQRGLDPSFALEAATILNSTAATSGFYLDQEKLNKTELRYRTEYTLQPIQEIAYYTDRNNTVCVNTKEQILNGEGRGREILELWYKIFPDYSNEINPFAYLKKNELGTLLISNKALAQWPDSLSAPYKKISSARWTLFMNQNPY